MIAQPDRDRTPNHNQETETMSKKQRDTQYDPDAESGYSLKCQRRAVYARAHGYLPRTPWPAMGVKDSRPEKMSA